MSNQAEVPSLYHYTSNFGLVGMHESQELWFSDVRFLNDSKEYKHACSLLGQYIQSYAGKYRQKWTN